MAFDNVIPHLVHAARMHRSNALACRDAAEVERFESLVMEYDFAIRELSHGELCAASAEGVPLVPAPALSIHHPPSTTQQVPS